jgi:hypothetical protein
VIFNHRRGSSDDFYSACSNASKEAAESHQSGQRSHRQNRPRYLYFFAKKIIYLFLVISDCRFGLAIEAHLGDCSAKVMLKKTPTRPNALQLRAIRASPVRKALDFGRDDQQVFSPARPIAQRTLPIIEEIPDLEAAPENLAIQGTF